MIHNELKHELKEATMKNWFVKLLTTLICLSLLITAPSYSADSWSNYKKAIGYVQTKNFSAALPLLEGTEPWFLKTGNHVNTAMLYNNLGRVYAELKQYDKAVAAWTKEAAYWSKVGKTQERIAAERKAEMIRQDIRLFTKTSSAQTGPSGPFAPATGVMLGMYAENDKAINTGNANYALNAESYLGKKHAGFLLYYTYGLDLSNLKVHVANAKSSGSFLMLGIQPLNGLNSISDDAYLADFVKDIASFDMPVFIRFANEMNDPTNKHWYDKDPKKYIEKFQLVAKKIHEGAPNAVMVWAPAYFPPDNISAYYPGDAYVDWVGVSIYRQYHPELDPLEKGIDRFSYLDHFKNIYQLYGSKKPIMVAEGAVSYTDYKTGKDVTAFATRELSQYLSYMPMLYPNLKAMFYFDTSTGKGTSYRLSDNPTLLAAYKTGIQNSSYVSGIGQSSGFSYQEVKTTLPADVVSLSGFVKVPDNNCVKLSYAINGKVLTTSTSLPYEVQLDLSAYKGKTLDLTVKGYDVNLKLLVTKTFKIKVL